eukprot:scaffold291464_cov35-Tisochrysis_lutea.AAC.1
MDPVLTVAANSFPSSYQQSWRAVEETLADVATYGRDSVGWIEGTQGLRPPSHTHASAWRACGWQSALGFEQLRERRHQ